LWVGLFGDGYIWLPENSDSRGKDDSCFGVSCADRLLSGVEHTFPSLLLWKCQLEKLKEDVDQALNRVCEGLYSFGPGCKSKRFGRKNSNKKKKRRLRWAPVAQKPRDDPIVAVRPDVGPSSASGYGGSETVPAVSELSGGVCPSSFSSVPYVSEIQYPKPGRDPLPDFGTTAQEVGVGSHGSMAFSPVSPGLLLARLLPVISLIWLAWHLYQNRILGLRSQCPVWRPTLLCLNLLCM